MKISKLFSKDFFLDTIFRIRGVIIFSLVYFTLISLATPITLLVAPESIGALDGAMLTLHPYELLSLGMLSTLVVPIMTVTAFFYVYKRHTADFYDHLPYTRLSMAVSSLAAVLASAALVITVASLVPTLALIPSTVSGAVRYDYLSGISYAIASLLISLYTMGATFLAVSVTGSVFRTVIITLTVILVPRLSMYTVKSLFEALSPTLVSGHSIEIFNNSYNLCTALAVNNYTVLKSPVAFIYTACLALLLIALGVYLYRRRPSEMATHPFTSRAVFEITRISVSVLLMLVAILLITLYALYFLGVLILLSLALAHLLVGYPRLRRILTLRRGLLSLLISVGIATLIFLSTLLGSAVTNNYKPSPDEITSVSPVRELGTYQTYINYLELVNLRTSDIELQDGEIRALVATAIERGMPNNYFDYKTIPVKIKSGIFTKYRTLYLTAEECATFNSALIANDSYKTVLTDVDRDAYSPYIYVGGDVMGSAECREILERYKEEAQKIGYAEFSDLLYGAHSDALLCYSVDYQGVTLTVNLPIFEEMTETMALYKSYAKAIEQRQYNELISLLDSASRGEKSYYLSLSYYAEGGYYYAYIELPSGDAANREVCDTLKSFISPSASYEKDGVISISLWTDELRGDEVYISLLKNEDVEDSVIVSFFKQYEN